jgi:flavin-dependent dehydrogenase
VARLAGWPDERHLVPALEYEVPVDDGTLEALGAEPRFDAGTVPFGYAWVSPKAAHVSVGVLSMQRGARDLHALVANYLTLLGIKVSPATRRHGYVIPVRSRSGPFMRGRVLVVGDAAGFVDPVAAEGISFALRSGQLAGEALVRGSSQTDRASAYAAGLGHEILPQLRAGRPIARWLYRSPAFRRALFGRFGQQVMEGMADVFTGTNGYGAIPRRALVGWARGRRRLA